MIIIGITGNSGAGKDTVSMIIKTNLDSILIDADIIMRENQKEGYDYYNKIVDLFGKKVIKENKNIDRTFLAKEIFSNEEKRNELNKLTFECVQKEVDKILDENKNKDFIILNFPLLYEGNFDKICDYVIAITADMDTKIKRIILRDKVTTEDANKRIASQKSEEFYKANADFIIDNSNNVNYIDLIKETKKILNKIKEENKKWIKKRIKKI